MVTCTSVGEVMSFGNFHKEKKSLGRFKKCLTTKQKRKGCFQYVRLEANLFFRANFGFSFVQKSHGVLLFSVSTTRKR